MAVEPTILATSGGFRPGGGPKFHHLVHYGVELSGVSGRTPRIATLGTASGDQGWLSAVFDEAATRAGFRHTPIELFPMPSVPDVEAALLDQDLIWVGGGSVANLLAVWRVHGLDAVFRRVWEAGVVLSGVSAGSLCWFIGGTTDSFGPSLRPVTNGLALLPYGNGVHYDTEERRRPLVHQLVADGTLPETHCTDNGVGLVYRGTELVEAVSETPDKSAYIVTRTEDGCAEERIPTRYLG